MKFFLLLSFSLLFFGCGGPEGCRDRIEFQVDNIIKECFNSYSINQQIVFNSSSKTDTLFVTDLSLDTLKFDCETNFSKTIKLRSKLIFNNQIVPINLTSGAQGTSISLQDSLYLSVFSVTFIRKEQGFSDKMTSELIGVLDIDNTLFRNVIKIKDLEHNKTFFFAPNKGLIRWIYLSDTLTIKF